MRQITQYTVVTADTTTELAAAVQAGIHRGLQPLGGVAVMMIPGNIVSKYQRPVFAQAMVRYGEEL